jgi:hypothetical protein
MPIQLLVPSVPKKEKIIVHSSALDNRGVRVEKNQQN